MKKTKSVAKSEARYDELDAVREVSGILNGFADPERERILRWVRERLDLGMDGGGALPAPSAVLVQVAPARQVVKTLRNPHEMAKPPLGKVIIQDDDDDGDILGIPQDSDLPEPPEAAILKPNKETRRLVKKYDYDKHGNRVSESVVMAK